VNEEQKYWRDKLTQILQWAVALYILLIGWSMEKHGEFELFPDVQQSLWREELPRGQFIRAVGLISFGLIYAVILPLAIHSIYKKLLLNDSELDKTVLSYRFYMTCALVLSALTLLVAVLTSVW
jgi:hypothetical protein